MLLEERWFSIGFVDTVGAEEVVEGDNGDPEATKNGGRTHIESAWNPSLTFEHNKIGKRGRAFVDFIFWGIFDVVLSVSYDDTIILGTKLANFRQQRLSNRKRGSPNFGIPGRTCRLFVID